MSIMKITLSSIAIVALAATTAQAAIIYVDATADNTIMAASVDGPVGAGTALVYNTTDSADGIWRYRTGFGVDPSVTTEPTGTMAGGTVWESTGNSNPSDNVPRLKTSVTGLANDTYDVYVYFWQDQNNSPWRIRAGLEDTEGANSLTLFNAGESTQVAVDGTGRKLYRAYLGQLANTSAINVFVEDAPAANGNERTWYDGIGYEVIPEPATLGLVGIFGAGVLFVRRRFMI